MDDFRCQWMWILDALGMFAVFLASIDLIVTIDILDEIRFCFLHCVEQSVRFLLII